MDNSREIVSLFVTGGWDSTFMLCKMSQKHITIRPIYVLNTKRKSYNRELEALESIIKALSKHPKTRAKILQLKMINLSSITIDQDIVNARRRLASKVGLLGYQYDYLATIARAVGKVGLGIENSANGHDVGANATLRKFAKLKSYKYGYIIDESKTSRDACLVFENIFFPIIDTTELEMREWTKKNGYSKIMNLIQFCHFPIRKQPCGLCRPCEEKMSSYMDFLLPKKAQKRYFKNKKYNFLGRKTSRFIKNVKLFFLSDKP